MSADDFHIFGCIFKMKILNKVSACSLKSFTICENPSRNPLQEACSGFSEAACDSKSCSENSENCSESWP
jgi:hypothetical protein